jgi:hypothetical protein
MRLRSAASQYWEHARLAREYARLAWLKEPGSCLVNECHTLADLALAEPRLLSRVQTTLRAISTSRCGAADALPQG